LTISLDEAIPTGRHKHCETRMNLHGTTVSSRPLRCEINGSTFRSNNWSLPLPNCSLDSISCSEVFEFVRDDTALAAEISRLLKPGGKIRIEVPNAGGAAGLDAYNLYRYFVDTTRRGRKPYETAEIGWRRHYSAEDVSSLLGREFAIRSSSTRGVGISEAIRFGAMVICRYALGNDALYRRTRPLIDLVQATERRLKPGPSGWLMVVDAQKCPSAAVFGAPHPTESGPGKSPGPLNRDR
jgi:SAM-dependent methyltransferase